VQHGLVHENNVTVIDSAHSDFYSVSNKSVVDDPSSKDSVLSPQFDGSASWWTQVLGHAHPSLTLAAARASGRYGHVLFPQAVHLPALKLAEKLIHDGPGKGWASRAFFSDNGSTGMEVTLKMAIRAYSSRHGEQLTKDARKKLGVLGLKGSYHGDTIGAMNASEEGVYTCEWHDAHGYWLDPPTVGMSNGQVTIKLPNSFGKLAQNAPSLAWVYDVEERLHTPLARAYLQYFDRILPSLKDRLAALVLEPLVMGAGGMLFVDPLFQRLLVDTVRNRSSGHSTTWSGMPVIFDEVFVGLNRVGVRSAGPLLGVHPDISVYAKALTGGLVPLSVTLASKSIFEAFLSDKKADALLHGHSYTAYPVGCEVANEALTMMETLSRSDDWVSAKATWAKPDGSESPVWSLWDPGFITAVSKLPNVEETMTLGSVLSIRIQDKMGGEGS
jgi:dethiobiotin synthetase/adenosylmethionine--8-amino-7-oxononanoate aminotransferase